MTGDRAEVAREVAAAIGIDEVYADQTRTSKLASSSAARATRLGPVVMVGDGINDAPALALADVGIAMAGKGATISSETADVVITVDRADRIAALHPDRPTLAAASPARASSSAWGCRSVAMFVAAFGYLPPVGGALLQEVIDVAVILNALRALRG